MFTDKKKRTNKVIFLSIFLTAGFLGCKRQPRQSGSNTKQLFDTTLTDADIPADCLAHRTEYQRLLDLGKQNRCLPGDTNADSDFCKSMGKQYQKEVAAYNACSGEAYLEQKRNASAINFNPIAGPILKCKLIDICPLDDSVLSDIAQQSTQNSDSVARQVEAAGRAIRNNILALDDASCYVCRHHADCLNRTLAKMGTPGATVRGTIDHVWNEFTAGDGNTGVADSYNGIYYETSSPANQLGAGVFGGDDSAGGGGDF